MQKRDFRKIILAAVVIIPVLALIIWQTGASSNEHITHRVQRGTFTHIIVTSGQLQAENSVVISAPGEISSSYFRLDEIKIIDLVEEGTVVDSGDYVATLDYAAVEELRKEALTELEKARAAYEDAKLDTNINLTNQRDELLNARVALEEKTLVLEQSVYESPSVQRQAKLEVERSQRDLDQKLRNYDLKVKQEEYKVYRAAEEYQKAQKSIAAIDQLTKVLEVKAPAPGLIIFSYDRMGNKIKVGSKVSRYMPKIAELPDLNQLISSAFVNEIDISKIAKGQKVAVGVDAFPDKQLEGEVISVANIGKVLPGGDSKVFEVRIRVLGNDPMLKPGMTTSNRIMAATQDSVLILPLEALHANDSITYTYLLEGSKVVAQQVLTSGENDNYCAVEGGLNAGNLVLLNLPADAPSEIRMVESTQPETQEEQP